MDSPESQDLHPSSDSVPSGTTTESVPPVGNNPPGLPLDGGGGARNKRKWSSSDGETENDESDVNIMSVSTPSKEQTESSSSKETVVDSGDRPWTNEDINLLADVLDFYEKRRKYPFVKDVDQTDFYENWVRGRGVYADYVEVSHRLDDLSSWFYEYMERKCNGEDVETAMNPTEAEIFQLSSAIWGKERKPGEDPFLTKEERMDVEMTDSTNSTKRQSESSTGKGKEVVPDTSSSREGNAEEIGLLTDLYTLHSNTGRYLFSGINSERHFYKFWIEEEGVYANKEELDTKINELHARFLKNMDDNVQGPTDPMDVEIFRLSHWIWGDHEFDSHERTHHDEQSSTKDPDDSSKQEKSGDQSDPKDSTAPSSKPNAP